MSKLAHPSFGSPTMIVDAFCKWVHESNLAAMPKAEREPLIIAKLDELGIAPFVIDGEVRFLVSETGEGWHPAPKLSPCDASCRDNGAFCQRGPFPFPWTGAGGYHVRLAKHVPYTADYAEQMLRQLAALDLTDPFGFPVTGVAEARMKVEQIESAAPRTEPMQPTAVAA